MILVAPPRTDEEKINLIITKRLSSEDVNVVNEAMELLASMISDSNHNAKKNRKVAFRRSAPITTVLAMRRHGTSAQIQGIGCRVLACISCFKLGTKPSVEDDIIAVGGLKACLLAMKRHPTSPFAQANGCHLINNLWCSSDVRKKLVSGDEGIKAVANSMQNFVHHGDVQRRGCQALKVLLSGHQVGFVQAVADEGCIDHVIAAMNNHPHDAKLQEYGCQFLCRLSQADEKYRIMIIDAKVLGSLGEALRIHNGNEKVTLAAQKALKAISAF